ncbi:uncharacterized protein LOC135847198 [Planococcus citri]|uniref:uncharacterized protein LOC135847198 n=1 Tax=Planococcus citri TaxID=170843 RepID=UPI0031F73C51
MLEQEDIIAHLDNHLKPWLDGTAILKAEYLTKVGVKKKSPLHIIGLCRQVSKPAEAPHRIDFKFNTKKPGKYAILKGNCSCTGGASGKCKHSTALLQFLMKVPASELEALSCTDDVCQWIKGSSEPDSKPIEIVPVSKFCHFYKPIAAAPAIPNFFNSPEFKMIMEGAGKNSSFFKHHAGRKQATKEEYRLSSQNNMTNVRMLLTHKDPSFPSDDFNMECIGSISPEQSNFYHNNVILDEEKALRICIHTVNQAKSDKWLKERKLRITASRCYELYTYFMNSDVQGTANWKQKHKNLFKTTVQTNDMEYGKTHEETALQIYEKLTECKITRLGLTININVPYLGFSPDRIVFDDEITLLEVKCPRLGKTLSITKMLDKLDYVEKLDSGYSLKKNHPYYGQVQLALCLSGIKKGHFIIYNEFETNVFVIDVLYDEQFCKTLVGTLTIIYFEYLLCFICASN